MEQYSHAKCWSCNQIFTVRLSERDFSSPNRVLKIVPCPYCSRGCSFELYEDQVSSIKVILGGKSVAPQPEGQSNWLERLPPGALVDHVFETSRSNEDGDA